MSGLVGAAFLVDAKLNFAKILSRSFLENVFFG